MTRPVRVTGRENAVNAFVNGLCDTLHGWSHCPSRGGTPFCTVRAGHRGYTVDSDFLDTPFEDLPLASAVCAVIADMSEAYIEAHTDMRALHCGAVRIGGCMVLLCGEGHAGKSTLVARLGVEQGTSIYCDDVLPIRSSGAAVALGVPPRVRVPLPDSASAGFKRFVQDRASLRDDGCAYVACPAVVPHGTEAWPEALLLLQRTPGAAPKLHAVSPDEAAAAMLAQDLSFQADGLAHIERVAAMANGMLCATFVYDDLDAAAEMLRTVFGTAELEKIRLQPAVSTKEESRQPLPSTDMSLLWRRNGETGLRCRHGSAFLWAPQSGRYFRLNPVGLACWHLIERPTTGADLADDLGALFPDAPARQVREDVGVWLTEMADNGLLQRA